LLIKQYLDLIFGDYEKDACVNWTFHESSSDKVWAIKMNEANFSGIIVKDQWVSDFAFEIWVFFRE
jgi:hypothetical protein